MTENQKLREAFDIDAARQFLASFANWRPDPLNDDRHYRALAIALDYLGDLIGPQALALPTAEQVDDINVAESFTSVTKTAPPDMPLSMNQFGRLVELTREHLTDNTFVYKATSKAGDTCHFGVESAAKAWSKGGTVEPIKVREFKLHTSGPTADHIPDAGEMVNGLTQAETDASASVSGLTAPPVVERELFERTMMDKFGWERKDFKTDGRDFYMDGNTVTAWMTWQARSALSAGDAADAQRYRWLMDNCTLGIKQNGVGWSLNTTACIAPDCIKDVGATIDAAMRKGQL